MVGEWKTEKMIVVGATLEALLFAYINNFPVYYSIEEPPFFWEQTNIYLDVERFYLPFFFYKTDFYSYLFFILSLSGNIPFRHEERKQITIKNNKLLIDNNEIEFEKAFIFSNEGINGFPEPKQPSSNKQLVIDFFSLENEKRTLITGSRNTGNKELMNEVVLFSTNQNKFHILTKSFLSLEQLEDKNYSIDEVLFMLKEFLKENKDWIYPYNERALKVFPLSRENEPLKKAVYKDENNLKFMLDFSMKELLFEKLTFGYCSRVSSYFLSRQKEIKIK